MLASIEFFNVKRSVCSRMLTLMIPNAKNIRPVANSHPGSRPVLPKTFAALVIKSKALDAANAPDRVPNNRRNGSSGNSSSSRSYTFNSTFNL